jgi:septal ring factor EnvC (AmiA/AmiB activator)
MSRLPTICFGLALLGCMAWLALTIEEAPFADAINAAGARLFGPSAGRTTYADGVFSIFWLCMAAAVGVTFGWSLRGQAARDHEVELQRRLFDTQGRIPRLETGIRNREQQVARAEMQLKEVTDQLPPLKKAIDEGQHALRDRDRTISLLRSELTALKAAEQFASESIGLGRLADAGGDAERATLEARIKELEAELETRQARITELMQQPRGEHVDEALKSELDDQRRRNEVHDRERQRQDKWLDVLNDQLARSREANDKLQGELADQQALKARIASLEAEIARLNNEIADRERRLATSRFECATARTTITHLQAQLERTTPSATK